MSEREDSGDERAVGLTVRGENLSTENVNPAPSHPDEESFADRIVQASESRAPLDFFSQPAGASVFPIPLPSFAPRRVTVYDAAWCPSPPLYSPFHPYRFPDASTGITLRLPDPNSSYRPLSVLQSSLSMRPETPSTPLGHAMIGDKQRKLTQEASELCAALEEANVDTVEPMSQGLRDTGQTAAEGDFNQFIDNPNNSATPGNEENSAAAAVDDGESPPALPVLLRESSEDAEISKPLTQSTAVAVDLSLVQGDTWNLELFLPECYAKGIQMDCLGDEKMKLLGSSQLPCGASPGSPSLAQFDAGSLNTIGSDFLDPSASVQISSAAVREAPRPDTGQSAEDDDDLNWGSCKICWRRFWRVVFIPCGHGSCKPCYKRLMNMTCPFCRERIHKIVEVLLSYDLEA